MSDRAKYQEAVDRQNGKILDTPVPWRITFALDYRELYGPEVDQALGGEEPMVDQWEAGELVPTAEQIEKLADLTHFPVKFFYMAEPEPLGPMWICQRSGKGKGCRRVEPDPAPEPRRPAMKLVPTDEPEAGS